MRRVRAPRVSRSVACQIWPALGALCLGLAAFHSQPALARRYPMPQAASLHFTPRGLEYFQTQTDAMVRAAGVDLTHNNLRKWEYTAEEPLRLGRLPGEYQSYARTLQSLRNTLKEWLIGFDFSDPRVYAQVSNSRYQAPDVHLAVVIDPALTERIGVDGTIGALLQAFIPDLRIEADWIRAVDLANTFLGTYDETRGFRSGFGINHPWVELNDTLPIQVDIPIRVSVSPHTGNLEVEALGASTNLDRVHFDSGWDRGLILPTVRVRVNGQTITLRKDEVERSILRKRGDLVAMGQRKLKELIERELPHRLNTMLIDKVVGGFEMIKEITAPGIDYCGPGDSFNWGIRLQDLDYEPLNGFLDLTFRGYLEDPSNPGLTQPAWPSKRAPRLSGRDAATYDLALAFNADMINRVIYLARQRGTLDEVSDGTGGVLPLVRDPFLTFIPGSRDRARLHVVVRKAPEGLEQKLALNGPFEVELDVEVRFELNNDRTGFNVMIDHIVESTAFIDDRFLRFNYFREDVDEALLESARKINAGWRRTPLILAEDVEIPLELYGIRLSPLSMDIDPNGHLVFYLVYENGGSGP